MLNLEIPEDYEPIKITQTTGRRDDIQYWVYLSGGQAKKYRDATSEETLEWASSLFGNLGTEDDSFMKLMATKGAILEICLNAAIYQHRNLFGGPEAWESIPKWQRVSNVFKKGKE